MTADPSTRTLRVLLKKYEQDESRAGETLADAASKHQRAKQAREHQELQRTTAQTALAAYRAAAASRMGAAVDADWLRAAHAYKQRLVEQLELEERRLADARTAEQQAHKRCEDARQALAEAKGRREVVEKRIQAAVKALQAKAEAQAEEEAADRARGR